MPWKETHAVSERHHLVDLVVHNGIAISQAARSLGISRKTAHKWLARYDKRGRDALTDQSRARHTQSHSTPIEILNLLVELRKKTGVGPRQLLWKVHRLMPLAQLPAVSTVSSILMKAGLIESKSRKRRDPDLRGPDGSYRAGTRPNEQWTVDFKGQFRLGDRSLCYPLTIQDDATRFVLCVDGYGSTGTNGVMTSFQKIFQERGLPERIHSDNGSPFASSGIGRLSRVSVQWMRQGIEVCRSRVGHPQDNPRHERMHRTLKAQTARPPGATALAQQRRFSKFVRWMNEERGHEGIGMRAPCEIYTPSAREWCHRPDAVEYPGHWEVRRIRQCGEMKFHCASLFLSTALAGEAVGLAEIDEGIWRVCYRNSALCFVNTRLDTPTIIAESPDEKVPECDE